MTTAIFSTFSGGAGSLAQKFARDFAATSLTPRLQSHLFSLSRTTRYFFLLRVDEIYAGTVRSAIEPAPK